MGLCLAARTGGRSEVCERAAACCCPRAAGQPDGGGYSVDVARALSGRTIGLGGALAGGGGGDKAPANGTARASASAGASTGKEPPQPPQNNNDNAGSGTQPAGDVSGRRRALRQQLVVAPGSDALDAFRRAAAREACANAAAYSWRAAALPAAVDVRAYRAAVAGVDVVDVLAEAARLLDS